MRASGEAVAVVGGGGIGGYLAGELQRAGHPVTLCVRSPIEALVIESSGTTREVPLQIATSPSGLPAARWLFLTVKAQDVGGAAPWLTAADRPDTTVVVVQNGVDHDRVRTMVRTARVMPAIIYCSAERIAPGRIRHHNSARLLVARGEGSAALKQLFAGSLFEIVEDDDYLTTAWRKLLSNVSWNVITALTLRRASVFHAPDVQDLARGLLNEALAVAQAEGAKLGPADVDALVSGAAVAKPGGGSSMLYDRLQGRPTEHDHITGAVVTRAARHGIPVPLNRAVLTLLAAASGHPLDGSTP